MPETFEAPRQVVAKLQHKQHNYAKQSRVRGFEITGATPPPKPNSSKEKALVWSKECARNSSHP